MKIEAVVVSEKTLDWDVVNALLPARSDVKLIRKCHARSVLFIYFTAQHPLGTHNQLYKHGLKFLINATNCPLGVFYFSPFSIS